MRDIKNNNLKTYGNAMELHRKIVDTINRILADESKVNEFCEENGINKLLVNYIIQYLYEEIFILTKDDFIAMCDDPTYTETYRKTFDILEECAFLLPIQGTNDYFVSEWCTFYESLINHSDYEEISNLCKSDNILLYLLNLPVEEQLKYQEENLGICLYTRDSAYKYFEINKPEEILIHD